jgi:hypothetical protein
VSRRSLTTLAALGRNMVDRAPGMVNICSSKRSWLEPDGPQNVVIVIAPAAASAN